MVPTPQQAPSSLGVIQKLPPEIRIKIYEEVFRGSEVTFTVITKAEIAKFPTWCKQIRTSADRSCHHTLLHASHTIYMEAVEIYWSTSLVYADEFRFFRRDFANLHRLARGLSTLVRENIKHLREIRLSPDPSFPFDNPPPYPDGIDNRALLAQFKKLETVSFVQPDLGARPCLRTLASVQPEAVEEMEEYPRVMRTDIFCDWRMITGKEPKRWLKKRYGLDLDESSLRKIHFLRKHEWRNGVRVREEGKVHGQLAITFLNYSSGLLYTPRQYESTRTGDEAFYQDLMEASRTMLGT